MTSLLASTSALARRVCSSSSTAIRASSSSSASSLVPHSNAPSTVSYTQLPPVILNLIHRYLQHRDPSLLGAPVSIPNPFLASKPHGRHVPPSIPVRRQKQLLAHYPSTSLPSSPLNPSPPTAVQWHDGTLVSWSGSFTVPPPSVTGVYGRRKRMFKGHKHEREREAKVAERQARLDGMDKRIAEWKKTRDETKEKLKPSLPF